MTNEELILTSILGCERAELYANPLTLTANQKKMFQSMKKRCADGEPVQYVTGFTDFVNVRLNVSEHVLIPRPETELMVEAILDCVKQRSWARPVRILDLGTGSGNIAVALAKNLPDSQIVAVDCSQASVDIAKNNAEVNGVADRITFVILDMFDFFLQSRAKGEKFDVIVSNPPYIPTALLPALPRDVQYEPRLALDGGEDGLDFYRLIIGQSSGALEQGGSLFCEFGDGQKTGIESMLRSNPEFKNIVFSRDYTKTDRFFCAQNFS